MQKKKPSGQMRFDHTPEEILMDIKFFKNSLDKLRLIPGIRLPNALSALVFQPRRNQAFLSDEEKKDFNQAVKLAIDDGSYDTIVAIHEDMSHRMHTMRSLPPADRIYGTLRFLPWHRVYVYVMELLLQSKVAGVRIPFWMWERNHTLLSWLYLPSGLSRGPDTEWSLPVEADVLDAYSSTTYLDFTLKLEGMHNTVHMWVGGIMQNMMSSPKDPLFWLHHANVDRIWHTWDNFMRSWGLRPDYPVLTPPLDILDPWSYTIESTRRYASYNSYYSAS